MTFAKAEGEAKAEGGRRKAERTALGWRLVLLVLVAFVVWIRPVDAGPVASFADIEFWVGTGANEAALAIDWVGDDSQDTALVWGYRWNGAATGETMLRDILAADTRLFAKLSSGGTFGISTFGFGYDQNDDDLFAIDDGTTFNADGIAITTPADGAESVDPADRYREGWFDGYWHYATGVQGAGQIDWTTSGTGVSQRSLSSGDWDSYAFAVTLNADEFAQTLTAATAPGLPGDFNGDGSVDVADYTVWRDTLGDIPSYLTWKNHYGTQVGSLSAPLAVPEPATSIAFAGMFVFTFLFRPLWRPV
ncbi:MAG: hypothetical protein AAGF31_02510 [Planctomycetota bacterium]